MTRRRELSRRRLLSLAGAGASTVLAAGFPAIVPASVFGATAPSNRINVGAIGTGHISRTHDMPGVWQYDTARIIAVPLSRWVLLTRFLFKPRVGLGQQSQGAFPTWGKFSFGKVMLS